jgi:acyl dehydratase
MGLLYEQFRVGHEFETETHEVTAAGIAAFAELTGDDNPLHTDREYARAAGFRDVLAHGPYVQALAIGLSARTGLMAGTTVALLGISAQFRQAVFPGDRIRARIRISRKRSTRSPDRGLLWRHVDVLNQDDVVVASMLMTALMRRQTPSATHDGR